MYLVAVKLCHYITHRVLLTHMLQKDDFLSCDNDRFTVWPAGSSKVKGRLSIPAVCIDCSANYAYIYNLAGGHHGQHHDPQS